ncbi:MAG: integrase [Alphaproteobacteria bacterium]|jgi:site-specific recombinase XerD|nr:integrase [Alphaproteobacteria bacterium]
MSEATLVRMPSFAALVQQFFTDYLLAQRAMSPNTVASYRDAMLLFLDFAYERLGKMPTELRLTDLEPDLILAFLDDLEQRRNNSVRSRNLRLTALRAFLKFAGRRDVASLLSVEQALGVPMKRFERPMLGFLSREEMTAVIGDPGATWTSQRDHLLLTMLYNTGARVSEIIAVRVADVVLEASACVHLHGKGRKQRAVPLWKSTVQEVRAWLRCNPVLAADAPLLPNRDGRAMTRQNVNQRFDIAVTRATQTHPSLARRHISPHTIRHSTAMHMLQSGVAFSVIALWMGHESVTTTHRYVEADLTMKEQALARLEEPHTKIPRYRPPDALRAFLEAL